MNDAYDDDSPFWGDDRTPTGQIRRIGRDVTSQLSRIVHEHHDRHHYDRTRQHRTVRVHEQQPVGTRRQPQPLTVDPYDYDLDDEGYAGLAHEDHRDDAMWADVDAWVSPEDHTVRRRSAVDPRLLRLGALAAAAVIALPIAVAFAAGDDAADADGVASAAEAPAVVPQEAGDPAPSTIPITAAVSVPNTAAGVDNPADDDLAGGATAFQGVTEKGATGGGTEGAGSGAAAPDPEPEQVCAGQYTVVPGDYWLRFGDGTGASVDAWLQANDATLDTSLFPGDELCIPEGAAAPAAPATTAAPTTAAPAATAAPATTAAPADPAPAATAAPTTEAPTTAAPTTAAPTTAPPVTTAAPRPTSPPTTQPSGVPSDVEGIIRYVFPDDQEDYAITIARRESGLNPRADNNFCCYGLFQIYYRVHASWLADLGINSAQDLFDPYKNTLAAYTLWSRSGWSPWSTHY